MKKWIAGLLLLFGGALVASAQNRYQPNFWIHSTDCTALIGEQGEFCFEADFDRWYVCEPSAGNCDTGAEWKPIKVDAGDISAGTVADARIDGSAEADEIDIDNLAGLTDVGAAITKTTADLTVSGVEVDFEAGGSEGYPRLAQSATPPSGDCDAAGEAGRLYFDSNADTDGSVFICTGSAWKDIDDDGGSGSPGGNEDDVQVNTASAFSGEDDFEYDTATNAMNLEGSFQVTLDGGVRGTDSTVFSHGSDGGLIDEKDTFLDVDVDQLRQSGADSASKTYRMHVTTSNNTPTEMTTDRDGARVVLTSDSTLRARGDCVARRTDADNESMGFGFLATIDRNVNATALVGTVAYQAPDRDDTDWTYTVAADDTNEALGITVTGETSKTIEWSCEVIVQELVG